MSRRQTPWWLYMVAASFCGYFVLQIYSDFWGTEPLGILSDYSGGRMVLREVFPDSPAAWAGLRPGDHLLAVEGQAIRSKSDWRAISANFEVGSPRRVEIERSDNRLEIGITLKRTAWSQQDRSKQLTSIAQYTAKLIALLLSLVIAFSRPRDSVALLGAGLLLTTIATEGPPGYGFAAIWRHLPAPLGALLWIAFLCLSFGPPIVFTFFALFPRKMFGLLWALRLAWGLGVVLASLHVSQMYRMVYKPEHAAGMSQNVLSAAMVLANLYIVLGLGALIANYRRLDDINERRRVRALVLGTVVGAVGFLPVPVIAELFPSFAPAFFSTPAPMVGYFLFLLIPVSFAYALLRHRLFDIRVVLRQGLRYAFARSSVLSVVPVLAAILLLDLWLHGEQPLAAILRAHGWVYASLVGLAVLAHTQRRNWLEWLDRRFFRERYDAQRLLREVVEEVRAAQSLEQEAPRAVARIEAALHPEFVALLAREPRARAYHNLASSPVEHEAMTFPAESKLIALVRLLGKPVEMPHTDSGWLQQQLPREETEFLRRTRIDLLVPVATSPERTEALLTLGTKRSEEPYSSEDRDLLVTIAASLAILLEKPAATVAPRRDRFEECPECGTCYDTGITRCEHDSAALVPVALPRLLEGRYRVDRRLGRGGMGAVYEAFDSALERGVAVKVIRDDLVGSAESAERFRREARAAAAFAHPNVVRVYDFGLAAGTRAFLVMELLHGVTLREVLHKERRLAPPRVLGILQGVCAAVDAAHRKQLLHRDLKPENIFLVQDDSQEIAKVLDFGVAKFFPGTMQEATVDTGTGMLVGTLPYMSPEQLRGEAATPEWDLWALGVVTYEMLTGAHPFAAESALEFERAIAAGQLTPVAAYLPEAPTSWQRFFNCALARDAARRPRSPETFFSELQSLLT